MSEEDARQAAYDRWNTTRSFVAPKAETFEAGFEAGRDYQRQQAPADADAELVKALEGMDHDLAIFVERNRDLVGWRLDDVCETVRMLLARAGQRSAVGGEME